MLNSLNKTIGDNLIRLREQRNLKQYEAAEQIGITRQTLAVYEDPDEIVGTRKPSVETLLRIAKFYGVSLDYLCGEIPGTTHDVSFVMEYTGLSESAVQYLYDFAHIDGDISPGERQQKKQLYRDKFGVEIRLSYSEILDDLLSDDSGFTEVLLCIAEADGCLLDYVEPLKSIKTDVVSPVLDGVTNYMNIQALWEARYRDARAASIDSFRDCIYELLPSIRDQFIQRNKEPPASGIDTDGLSLN